MKEGDGHRQRRIEHLRLLFDGAVVITGAIGIYFLIVQTAETRRANDIAVRAIQDTREAARIERRAWVGAVEAGDIRVIPGQPLQAAVIITNTGQTPARNVTTHIALRLRDARADFAPDYREVDGYSRVVIQPNQTVRSAITHDGGAADVNAVRAGVLRIYIFGRITYEDVFGQAHRTEYCYFIAAPQLDTAQGCSAYNYAD